MNFLNLCLQVFSEAKLWFSVGGKYFTGDPITYTYMEDRIFEHSRNITIKLHHRIGRAVKIQLFFASRWIMISEVNFDSGKCFFPVLDSRQFPLKFLSLIKI